MATKAGDDASEPLKYETWVLKVSIHCEGCKKKVKKVFIQPPLILSKNKVTVTGNVDGETLIKKLIKTGKHAELLPENFERKEKRSGNSKKKKNQNNPEPEVKVVVIRLLITGDGNGSKKKKKKGGKKGDNEGVGNGGGAPASTESLSHSEGLDPPIWVDESGLCPSEQFYPNPTTYYPLLAYGLSYNTGAS
ncbi:heavy metal transport/detoxification superfamily protein [Actinidia rufa]|uniref:Heavy metal transport/detoxification superfamily protein n=1 Tax=Actinidia rufa TaxID=165716 RepID=A0A7J0G1E9_9ERIC|nr:heavy metal transport/detoxification superfamily protein [Actinidia rufa]